MASASASARPARIDAKGTLYHAVTHSDQRVVQVDGRIAVGGDELNSRADRQVFGPNSEEDSVLVSAALKGHVGESRGEVGISEGSDSRHAAHEVARLGAAVDDPLACGGVSVHHRRVEEERLAKQRSARPPPTSQLLVASVVAIHEEVRSGLQLIVRPCGEVLQEGARPAARDAANLDPRLGQTIDGRSRRSGGARVD